MASRNHTFDFSDPNSAIGSLTDRFQGLRQALNPDRESSESSHEHQHPHRRPLPTPATNSTRLRRRTIQPTSHYSDLPVLRGSPSPSSSPAAYIPPVPRPGRGRHTRNSWRRFRREMQDDSAALEGLVRDRQSSLRQLHSQLNGVCYRVEDVYAY